MFISPAIFVSVVLLAMLEGIFDACKDTIGIPDKWQLSHLARWSRGEGRLLSHIFPGPVWVSLLVCFSALYIARGGAFNTVYRLLHLKPITIPNMKTFFKNLFFDNRARAVGFLLLMVIGFAVGQLLNPLIDPNFDPQASIYVMDRGDYISIALPLLLMYVWGRLIKWLYRPSTPTRQHSKLDDYQE